MDLRGEKNSDANLGSDSKNNGYRASFSFIDQFLDNTLGVALGYARLSSPVVGKEFGTYDPWGMNGTEHAGVPADVMLTDGIKSLASIGPQCSRRRPRDASSGGRASAYTSTLDLYWTSAAAEQQSPQPGGQPGQLQRLPVQRAPGPSLHCTANFSNLDIVGNSLIGATVGNVVPLARNFLYVTKRPDRAGRLEQQVEGRRLERHGGRSPTRAPHATETRLRDPGSVHRRRDRHHHILPARRLAADLHRAEFLLPIRARCWSARPSTAAATAASPMWSMS